MRKVVVAMDSMKGCLDSLSASRALADGITNHRTDVMAVCVPVADGGEGTAAALADGDNNFTKQISKVTGPQGTEILAEWYLDVVSGTAFIDMASASGLALISENERNPLHTTTFGVGELVLYAVGAGAKKVMLGLGGSATVDAGLGACQAMGLKILDNDGNELPIPFIGGMLQQVSGFNEQELSWLREIEIFLLCDVTAPFTGETGAARVFGPQKGATPEDVEFLEGGMENVRELIISKKGQDLNDEAGSGASGGMAGGLMAFAGGKIMMGAPMILEAIGFDKILEDADMILTGEGSSDGQTLMGKIPYEILQSGKRKNIPVWLVAGCVKDRDALLDAGFEKVVCINSSENAERSGTVGRNPMEPEVAKKRLFSMINDKVILVLGIQKTGTK
ncbi:MAG: glycerate kinase [Muribaculaceae bacterium]|nr:glycerate kinase [Muribaculaceae bacterium]